MLQKATPETEASYLAILLRKQERVVIKAFVLFVKEAHSASTTREIQEQLDRGSRESAYQVLDAHIAKFANVVPQIFQTVGIDLIARLDAQLKSTLTKAGPSVFDITNQRAAEILRQERFAFIRDLTRTQRSALQQALADAIRSGAGTAALGRTIRGVIGLTPSQLNAVERYRTALETGAKDALDRELRDRRFDRTVEAARRKDEPLKPEQIDRMVSRYRERHLLHRAEVIARTESLRAFNLAEYEALQQFVAHTGIGISRVSRTWQATLDTRTRDTHRAMDGQVVGLTDPFISPRGARLMFPGDPAAPGSETINCRCVVVTQIAPP